MKTLILLLFTCWSAVGQGIVSIDFGAAGASPFASYTVYASNQQVAVYPFEVVQGGNDVVGWGASYFDGATWHNDSSFFPGSVPGGSYSPFLANLALFIGQSNIIAVMPGPITGVQFGDSVSGPPLWVPVSPLPAGAYTVADLSGAYSLQSVPEPSTNAFFFGGVGVDVQPVATGWTVGFMSALGWGIAALGVCLAVFWVRKGVKAADGDLDSKQSERRRAQWLNSK